MKCVIDTNHLN